MENEYITPSGVRIYYEKNKQLHSFCLCLYVRAGSMYETEKNNGISHFFEHIIFRNIHDQMGRTLYQTLDRLGLEFNAVTYKEFMAFTITGAPKHFGEAAAILTRIFEPLSLPEEEIDMERRRIKAEIREEDEENSLAYFTKQLVWKDTSLAWTITGPKKGLNRMKRKQLRQFQKEVLTPENMFFYVTGCFENDQIHALAWQIMQYEMTGGCLMRKDVAPVPADFFCRKKKVAVKKGKKSSVCFGIDVDVNRYSFEEIQLLYDILFEGDFCRVHQALSERNGYVYSYDAWLEQYKNVAHIHLYYEVQPKNMAASIEEVLHIFSELKEDIGDALDYVRPYYIDNAYFILDHAEDYNWLRAYENHILEMPYHSMEERAARYRAVSPERITAICQEIFCKENMTLAVEGKNVDPSSIQEIWDR